jgi:hypothetical protein
LRMRPEPEERPGTHARIESLRLRLPAGDARTAKAVAAAVAARLAERAGELGVVAGGETVRVRVTASSATLPERLAETIAGRILQPPAERQRAR